MTAQQCRDEIQTILDRTCPKLMIDVMGNRTQMNIQYCMGHLGFSFCIDVTEWEKTKWPEHLVRARLLGSLNKMKNLIEQSITEIKI